MSFCLRKIKAVSVENHVETVGNPVSDLRCGICGYVDFAPRLRERMWKTAAFRQALYRLPLGVRGDRGGSRKMSKMVHFL